MDDKKDIGELFKKNLSEAEMPPKNTVWNAIERTLNRKRRKKLGYIWLLSLIGLLLLIFLFSISHVNYSDSTSPKNSIDSIVPQINSNDLLEKNTIRQTKNVVDNQNEKSGLQKSEKVISEKTTSADSKHFDEQSSQTDSQLNSHSKNKVVKRNINNVKNFKKEEEVAAQNNNSQRKSLLKNKTSFKETAAISKVSETRNIDGVKNKKTDKIVNNKNQENIAEKPISNKSGFPDLLNTKLPDSVVVETDTIQEKLKTDKKPFNRKIKRDSSKQPIKNAEIKKYRLFPFINTSYYTGLKKASAIDPQLNDKRKSSTLRMGYGAYLVFEASKKWNIRLGASHTAIQKNTFDVAIAPDDLALNYYKDIAFRDGINFISFSNSFSQDTTISLEEKLAYFKIPVEVSYTIWEKSKWGADAITGFSVSFLGKNKISAIREDGSKQFLGSNNNYSKGHFGFQFGSGLYYNPNQTIQLRLESLIEPRLGVFENRGVNSPVIINARLGAVIKL